jgi:transglutaminase-like putative cysteine protease
MAAAPRPWHALSVAAAGHPRSERSAPALVPSGVARVVGFVPLLCLGAHEWARLSAPAHGSPLRGLAWVVVALGAAAAVAGCARLAPGRRAAVAAAAAVGVAAVAALASGIDPVLLKPAHWGELSAGLQRGAEVLGVVSLPYSGADPWPQQTLDLGGALMLALAGLLVAWPRSAGRGFPFFAWALLLIPVVTPVVLLGGAQPLLLGLVLAILSVLFLWLERMPLRPGVGLAVLAGIALAGALPLGAAADRPSAWFDYDSFAERLVPSRPARFSWDQDYSGLRWPRDGRELIRVKTRQPAYLKAETLDTFDGERWRAGGGPQAEDTLPTADLAASWREHPEWTGTAQVEIRNLASLSIVGPGTLLGVDRETRRVYPGVQPGTFVTASELRRGDSYRVRFHAPQPTRVELAGAGTAGLGARANELTLHVPRLPAFRVKPRTAPLPGQAPLDPLPDADVAVPPFGSRAAPRAVFPTLGRSGRGALALRRSPYARTWALAQRLRRNARTPMDYVLEVDRFLKRGFVYTEHPPLTRSRAPLDTFLFDTKAGYCQHFSGAMALLLRMGGVPARVAAGFTPGGYQRSKGEWVVRDTDAHSWVEAWFPGYGWVTFDPTPAAAPVRSQIAPVGGANGAEPGSSQADAGAAGRELRSQAGSGLKQDAPESPQGTTSGGGAPFALLATVAVVLLLAAAALWRRRRLAALSPETAVERAVAELEVALRRSGHPMPVGVTLAQLERRLRLEGDAAAYLQGLRAGRYNHDQPPPTPSQRRALRRQLAEGLGIRGRVRGLWALPPWSR